jgi:hypothetical protein
VVSGIHWGAWKTYPLQINKKYYKVDDVTSRLHVLSDFCCFDKYWEEQLKRQKGLFWFTVSEGSVHGHLLHCCGPGAKHNIMVATAYSRTMLLTSLRAENRKEQEGLSLRCALQRPNL